MCAPMKEEKEFPVLPHFHSKDVYLDSLHIQLYSSLIVLVFYFSLWYLFLHVYFVLVVFFSGGQFYVRDKGWLQDSVFFTSPDT